MIATAAALAAGLGLLLAVAALRGERDSVRHDGGVPMATPKPAPATAPSIAPTPSSEVPPAQPAPNTAAWEDSESADQPPDPVEVALRWSAVDLGAVRDAMPDNIYWQMSAPTTDEALIQWREEERARWNLEYGKVLSGNASEEEIETYYAHRERVSVDSIEFASHLLDHYRGTLPERDVGLLELAIKLHHARLQEIPRRLADALERKQRQDALRAAWLADEAAFEKALRDQ